ncbi:unnamed protein product [Ceratitis capitata]|uniref:(Mediterranean fruit fly) hypothetical protein n=1 Tax=Ceratitis capitata TaxID=7213 RepID=A0A811VFW4_CERCA|nr:unnamed protein product [Ceratitis capitata]
MYIGALCNYSEISNSNISGYNGAMHGQHILKFKDSTDSILRKKNPGNRIEAIRTFQREDNTFCVNDTRMIYERETFPSHGDTIMKLEVEILPEVLKDAVKNYPYNDPGNDFNTSEVLNTNRCKFQTDIRTSSRCFFKLRSTDPSIVIGFIEIFERHPCQWNPHHYYFGHKDKRDESAVEICKEMADVFNLRISPKLARSSILFLIRWFECEFIRSKELPIKGRSSDNGYVGAHPDYFRKLIEFLPHTHLKLVHCDKCKRKFKSQNQLLVHNHQAHGGEMPFKCNYCKRYFLHASTWKHHENRHTKSHVWKCTVCPHESTTKTDRNIHMVTHSDIRAYVCDLCGASYKSSTSLNVHIRTHNAPRLQCTLCNQRFYENYRLKRHLLIHEVETSVEAIINKAIN